MRRRDPLLQVLEVLRVSEGRAQAQQVLQAVAHLARTVVVTDLGAGVLQQKEEEKEKEGK